MNNLRMFSVCSNRIYYNGTKRERGRFIYKSVIKPNESYALNFTGSMQTFILKNQFILWNNINLSNADVKI